MKANSIEEDIKILKELGQEYYKSGEVKIKALSGAKYIMALEHILSDYKRALKENEEYLKAINTLNKEKEDWIKAYQEEKDKQFELMQNTNNTIKTAVIAIEDLQGKLKEVIPIQKIKDKIEEIKAKMEKDCIALHEFQREAKIDVLQELLESEE